MTNVILLCEFFPEEFRSELLATRIFTALTFRLVDFRSWVLTHFSLRGVFPVWNICYPKVFTWLKFCIQSANNIVRDFLRNINTDYEHTSVKIPHNVYSLRTQNKWSHIIIIEARRLKIKWYKNLTNRKNGYQICIDSRRVQHVSYMNSWYNNIIISWY